MTNRLSRITLLFAGLLCSITAAAKIEVQPVQHKTAGRILAVSISEDIAPGDYEALLKGITGNPGKYAQKIVLLDSIGGSIAEALKMGRLLREAGFDAVVPATSICQGTCVYLLAAGHTKKVRGYVGIHRPYFPHGDSANTGLTSNRASYSSAAYFKQMNVADNLITDMNAIEPSKMRVLSPQELARYRLN
jgi:hypothetical protein